MYTKTLLTSVVLAGGLIYSAGSIGGTVTLDVINPGATIVPDSFGDTTDVDFTWGVGGSMFYFAGGYSGKDAFYCSFGTKCLFNITPLGGASLTLDSFELGGWPNTDRIIDWSISDLSDVGTFLANGTADVLGTTPFTVAADLTSMAGFQVSFGPDGFNGGLTGLTYTVTPVPLPAAGWLFFSALTSLGGLAWRRQQRMA